MFRPISVIIRLGYRQRYDRGHIGGDGKVMLKWVLKQVYCEDVD